MKEILCYNPYSNNDVTEYYINMIKDAVLENGFKTVDSKKMPFAHDKSKGIIVISPLDSIKARLKGYKYIICWVQGIIPEESFMRNHNYFRKKILSIFEKLGLNCSDYLIFVSQKMRDHFKEKYHFSISNYYIMPCFNTEIDDHNFYIKDKYKNNVFVYAGGLQPWQCFDESVLLYKKVENYVQNCFFKVLTRDKEIAEKKLRNAGVKNYSVSCVPQSKVADEVRTAKFGFAIRNDDIVNLCATPTKLSTYIGSGVLPIFSNSLTSFSEQAKNSKYCFSVSVDSLNPDAIIFACNSDITANNVCDDFHSCFGKYYSRNYHIERLKSSLDYSFKEQNFNAI